LLLVIAVSTLELVATGVRMEFGRRCHDLFIHPSPASGLTVLFLPACPVLQVLAITITVVKSSAAAVF
jgi:hypothetical protein